MQEGYFHGVEPQEVIRGGICIAKQANWTLESDMLRVCIKCNVRRASRVGSSTLRRVSKSEFLDLRPYIEKYLCT